MSVKGVLLCLLGVGLLNVMKLAPEPWSLVAYWSLAFYVGVVSGMAGTD